MSFCPRVGVITYINFRNRAGYIRMTDCFLKKDDNKTVYFHFKDYSSKRIPIPELGCKVYFRIGEYDGKKCATNVMLPEEVMWIDSKTGERILREY